MQVYEKLESGVVIVEYEDSLAASTAEMFNKSNENWGGNTSVKTESQVMGRMSASSNLNTFLAVDGETVVGYCSLNKYFADANTLYIPLLNVRPDYMGKKIGKGLVLKAVKRTIELGFPRLDLHSWPGNTEAIPLYKKCGFLWEDRADSVHLVNFIPSILKNGLFADFFKKADWYTDSKREIVIKPDGVKENGFEVFGYFWEKDGEMLKIGYERTGRLMRFVETNDYKIEFIADDHELAFGLSYGCRFSVTNKTGKQLHVKINGENDKNIEFDFVAEGHIMESETFNGNFFVGEVGELISKWRVHPRLRASVEINGQPVTFGLGIRTKFPVQLVVHDEYKVKHKGMAIPCHINVLSALPVDADVRLSVSENSFFSLANSEFRVNTGPKGKTSIKTELTVKSLGYAPIPVKYEISLKDGRNFSWTKPLHYSATDLMQSFYMEHEDFHSIFNGAWQFSLFKKGNESKVRHVTNEGYMVGDFDIPKLGKPYDEEFCLIKPNVKAYKEEQNMVMEVEYVSESFPGMVVTQRFTLSASGIVSRKSIVQNRGQKPREIMLSDEYGVPTHKFSVFNQGGEITMNHSRNKPDGVCDALDGVESEELGENWIFDENPLNPVGICWTLDTKPVIRWGNWFTFETECGELMPGDSFTTGEVQYVYGLFTNFMDFRNYALRTAEKKTFCPKPRVEVCINGHNPFVKDSTCIKHEVIHNREIDISGVVSAECDTLMYELEDDVALLNLEKLDEPIRTVFTHMKYNTYEKTAANTLFLPKGEVKKYMDGTRLVVDSGEVKFSVDPTYAHVCNSLLTYRDGEEEEWLNSKYPKLEPYAWWNPFLGGLRVIPTLMSIEEVVKEEITAEFTEKLDNFGNMWQGIKTTLTVKKHEENKGCIYESYFLTQPGLPVLCAYFCTKNETGIFWHESADYDAFLNFGGGTVFGEFVDEHSQEFRLRFGEEYLGESFVNTVRFICERKRNMYVFGGSKYSKNETRLDGDGKHDPLVYMTSTANLAPGETHTTNPMFLIVTADDIPKDALDELERVSFGE